MTKLPEKQVLRKELYGENYVALSKLTEQIYLGSCLEACDTELLKAEGITAVINLTREDFGTDAGVFNYFQLHQDDRTPMPRELIAKFLRWMDELIANGHKVLVHCQAGISRTPSLVIAWFFHRDGLRYPEHDLGAAWAKYEDKIGAVRPIIQPHYLLKNSVLEYFGGGRANYKSAFGEVEF